MYPTQTPHANWTGANQPNKLQVNLDFADLTFSPNQSSATNVWIASLVFHVEPDYMGGTIDLTLNAPQGNLIFANGDTTVGSTAMLGAPITLTVPEPALASLVLAGLTTVGLLYLRRRKSRIG